MVHPSISRLLVAAALSVLAAAASGCASRTSMPASSTAKTSQASRPTQELPADLLAEPPSEAIVAIHKSKCGSCHARVEPGSISRAAAESAMQRHRRRAKLTEREWEGMVDFLSSDHLHARPTARTP
jgi:hypothetical protein